MKEMEYKLYIYTIYLYLMSYVWLNFKSTDYLHICIHKYKVIYCFKYVGKEAF